MQTSAQVELTEQDVRDQLDRITRSESLKRSRRLQEFLRYVSELTLAGEASRINEYLLGVEVFERGPNYNASEDSVVRRQAHALRRKLGEYYSSEGARDPILIEIPLGHYVPVFRRNDGASAAPSPPVELEGPPSEKRRFTWAMAAVGAAVVALSFWVGRASAPAPQSGIANAAAQAPSGPVQELWSAWLFAERGPLLCLSSPLSAIVKDYAEPVPPHSQPPRLALPQELAGRFRDVLGLSEGGYYYISPSTAEAKGGEALSAVQLANLFAAQGLPVRSTRSNLLTWEDFRGQNLVVFGHNEQSQWIDPLLEDYPLRLDATSGEQQRRIVNREPREGESGFFQIEYAPQPGAPTIEYALVSMLPGLDGLHELLVVSGLNTQATLMAVEFLVDEQRAAQLLDVLRNRAPEHEGSWYFQLVLRAEVRDSVLTGGDIELIRVIDPETAWRSSSLP